MERDRARDLPLPKCYDCGQAYAWFPLNMVLPDQQWKALANGADILCADCILARAAKMGATVALVWLDYLDYSKAPVDQLEDRGDPNAKVAGSNPAGGTITERDREMARRIAELHPPTTGAWVGERCPQWITSIAEILAQAREEATSEQLDRAVEALRTVMGVLRLRKLSGTQELSPAKVEQLFDIMDQALAEIEAPEHPLRAENAKLRGLLLEFADNIEDMTWSLDDWEMRVRATLGEET